MKNDWSAVSGSATVFINGKPAHRLGDQAQHCGGPGQLSEGSSNVMTGGPELLRREMDKRNQMFDVHSNIMKSIDETQRGIIQNLDGPSAAPLGDPAQALGGPGPLGEGPSSLMPGGGTLPQPDSLLAPLHNITKTIGEIQPSLIDNLKP